MTDFATRQTAAMTRSRREGMLGLSKELGVRHEGLLEDHAGGGDHAQSAVVELLVLHLEQLRGVRRLEAEGIPVEVARLVVGSDLPQPVLGVDEGEDAGDLDDRENADHVRPEGLERRLLEGQVRRGVDVAAEERVEVLADQEAQSREHADTAMLELDLAVEADLAFAGLAAEVERVEEAERA